MDNKIQVVVADDIEILAKNLTAVVEKNEKVKNVKYVLNGEDEIKEITAVKADLVFTDMQMPKKTGLEVIETILSDSNIEKKPKFILVTSDRDISLVMKSRELGFDIEYKPISPERINEYIDNFNDLENDNRTEGETDIKELPDEMKKEGKFKNILKKIKDFFRLNN